MLWKELSYRWCGGDVEWLILSYLLTDVFRVDFALSSQVTKFSSKKCFKYSHYSSSWYLCVKGLCNIGHWQLHITTLKSAIAASSRNGTRTYPILLCHFITQNQKLRCSPETFRLSFYGIQGVPKKFELLTYPPSKDPGGKFCFQLQISKIWAPIELKFFWDTLDTIRA